LRSSAVCPAVVVFLLLPFFSSIPALATENQFIEDFGTSTHMDGLTTTADWNTNTGKLRLFPFLPTLIGAIDTPDFARDVVVWGDHVYIADGASGLQVINISDPKNKKDGIGAMI
jgi:hypothetical protein